MTLTGGPVFWILLALAAAAVAVFVDRLVELRRAQADWQDFVKGVLNVLESSGEDEAVAICEDAQLPVANVLAAAIRHRNGPRQTLREAVDSRGRAETGRLGRRLFAISAIAEAAPLLGLLGTISGFISAVRAADSAALVTRPDFIAATVDALVPAALGLAVAIPAAVMHGILKNKAEKIIDDLESAASAAVAHFENAVAPAAAGEPGK